MLVVEAAFCYLSDILCPGVCDSAIAARCGVARGKFRKLWPALTTRHISPRIGDKAYEACVRSDMTHGSERRGPDNHDLQPLHAMIVPLFAGFAASKTETKHPRCHYYKSWHYGHNVGHLLSITNFPIPDTRNKEGPGRRLNV